MNTTIHSCKAYGLIFLNATIAFSAGTRLNAAQMTYALSGRPVGDLPMAI
jgi:hypothetical protein